MQLGSVPLNVTKELNECQVSSYKKKQKILPETSEWAKKGRKPGGNEAKVRPGLWLRAGRCWGGGGRGALLPRCPGRQREAGFKCRFQSIVPLPEPCGTLGVPVGGPSVGHWVGPGWGPWCQTPWGTLCSNPVGDPGGHPGREPRLLLQPTCSDWPF